MSIFSTARQWLSGRRTQQPDQPTATDAVEFDSFDRIVWNEMLNDAPALGKLANEITRESGFGEDMVRDTFMSLFKVDPRLRAAAEMKSTHVANQAGMAAIFNSTELTEARQVCELDEYGAAMATTSVARTVQSEVTKHREAIEEAAQEAADAGDTADKAVDDAEKALDQAEQAEQDAQDAQDALDEANEDAAQQGGPTPGQAAAHGASQAAGAAAAAATAALQQAMQQALDTQQAAIEADVAAEEAAERATSVMQGAVDASIKEAADKVNEENQLLAAYGIGPGELQKLSYEQRAAYAKMISGSRLEEFRKLLGNMRMEFKAAQRHKTVVGRDHVIGITTGGLEDIVEDEMASLAHRALKLQFLQRLTAEQVDNYDYQGKEKVGDGAIIICVDNSGSMAQPMGITGWSREAQCPEPGCRGKIKYEYGETVRCSVCKEIAHTREAYAKALALALLDSAKRSKRDVVCLNWSSGRPPTEHYFPKGKADLPALIQFTEEFQNGGTTMEPPLLRSMEIIRKDFTKQGLANADVVFITDDDCHVADAWVAEHIDPVKRDIGVKIWGVAIGGDVKDAGPMSKFCDDVRAIHDLYDTSLVADIAKGIQ